jgi:hypothetical protein
MHLEILSPNQYKQLELLKTFKKEFTLVGGTAIALQMGHRKSIDFDLFKQKGLQKQKIKSQLQHYKPPYKLLFENPEGLHVMLEDVKWTFFQYPFPVYQNLLQFEFFKTPDLLTLAAMKAYALGRRAKWKDYVDLHQLLIEKFSISQIAQKASDIFGNAFSEKLFRVQLAYFKDIDYSEPIEWTISPIPEAQIQKELISFATDWQTQ